MDSEALLQVVHDNLLQQLKFIDLVCKKEGIEYSLCGGTMIGAVRHNGFIPWDDDVDVLMERADYIKFKSIIDKYLDGSEFVWYKHGRVEGITQRDAFEIEGAKYKTFADVFVLDNVPDDERKFRKHIFRLKKLQGMMKKDKIDWSRYSLKGKILVWGTRLLGKFHSMNSLMAKYEKLSVRYNDKPTKRKIVSNDIYAMVGIPYDKEVFDGIIEHDFETEKFPIYAHYDEILTAQYGDYMTPPPIEERNVQHILPVD